MYRASGFKKTPKDNIIGTSTNGARIHRNCHTASKNSKPRQLQGKVFAFTWLFTGLVTAAGLAENPTHEALNWYDPWDLSPKSYNLNRKLYQDPPCTLNWGYMVPNSRYLGHNRG